MIRRALVVLACAALAAAALPSVASAGTYAVRACFPDGINNSWHASRSNGFADAYTACPAGAFVGGRENEGMVARNTGGPGSAPGFSSAQMFFDAPPGARIVQVAGHIKQNSTGGWQAGLRDISSNRWIWCGVGCTGTFGSWVPFNIPLSTSRVAALTICGSGRGCARNALHGYAALRDVSVVVADYGPPAVAIRGGSVFGGWRRGLQSLAIDASDPVGIRLTRTSIDGRTAQETARECNYTLAAPCPNGPATRAVNTRIVEDGRHWLAAEAIDSAGNSRVVEHAIFVDNHAPTSPIGLSLVGGSGWRSGNAFRITWRNPAQAAAPITQAWLAICPLATGHSTCTRPAPLGKSATSTIRVPRAGRWRARIWLQDSAGNAASTTAASAVLQLDDSPPTLSILRQSADRPALIRVAARDEVSGLAVREILVRRRSSATWISLPVIAQAGGFAANIDDEALPRGVYEVRARAVDQAGNERSADRLADGKLAQLQLPLRIKSRLRVGRPVRVRAGGARRKGRYRIKLVAAPRAAFGRTIPLRGRLTSPGGNRLRGGSSRASAPARRVGSRSARCEGQAEHCASDFPGPTRSRAKPRMSGSVFVPPSPSARTVTESSMART